VQSLADLLHVLLGQVGALLRGFDVTLQLLKGGVQLALPVPQHGAQLIQLRQGRLLPGLQRHHLRTLTVGGGGAQKTR
jgi:hypothetical protein